MYNEKIENLINFALADGELTEKEKQILFKKAEEAGVDLDEFEMVLDAKVIEQQKKGAPSEKKDNVIKCPSCNDIIPTLSRVCPSCDYVLDSRKQTTGSEKGLEDLINDIEENLIEIKSRPQNNAITSLITHSYITLPLLTIIILLLGIRLEIGVLYIVAILLCILSYIIIKKKINSNTTQTNTASDYSIQKALFEKHSRTAQTLFGDNKKVKLLLNDLKDELALIEVNRNKNKKIEVITYSVLIFFTICVFFIPSKKNALDIQNEKIKIENENKKADKELLSKAEELIDNNKFDEAKLIMKDFKADASSVIIKSKIQLSVLISKMNEIEILISEKNYSKAKLELGKTIWQKISTEYSTEDVEKDVYSTFLKKKEAINNQLPEKYKIELESYYSF